MEVDWGEAESLINWENPRGEVSFSCTLRESFIGFGWDYHSINEHYTNYTLYNPTIYKVYHMMLVSYKYLDLYAWDNPYHLNSRYVRWKKDKQSP